MSRSVRVIKQCARFFLNNCLPAAWAQWSYKAWYRIRLDSAYRPLDRRATFESIYRNKVWGRSAQEVYYSGEGSHDNSVVEPYIAAVSAWLAAHQRKPNVVDLGCGDFSIGARLRASCGKYTACDIAAPIIEINQRKFEALNVEFKRIDIVSDELPAGDVVIIRQVLQHLSNKDIARVVANLAGRYRYLILTEHLPIARFVPNLDKTTGPNIRLLMDSGVVLTEPPFNMRALQQTVLCEADQFGGRIQTVLYEFPCASTSRA